jgi:hypothetical protein
MDVAKLAIDKAEADRLYREYRDHRHSATEMDDEIRRVYKEIARGKVVIRALESIRAAGLGVDSLPKLAIVRADERSVLMRTDGTGEAVMRGASVNHWRRKVASGRRFAFPRGTFPGIAHRRFEYQAATPHIPPRVRPRTALDQYHILFEAEWSMIPPVDPYLLRRIGESDMWIVCAAWDLTDVERAAMATRITAN